ncbi:MAG: hypothetical protein A3F90_06305 [Deltaproteobacteria bacterium RIFCSPLOWO2_12_FULL_60_19]|nr:MAG: hypothetical protein A3F90_06305 [Deltaproteobacteria bacterium RIFCSPLOWO2_12_FULL_60_19]
MTTWLDVVKGFALALASTLLFFLFGAAIPVAGFLLLPLVPQPVLALAVRQGKRAGLALSAVAVALVFILGGRELGLGYTQLALTAVLVLALSGRGWPIEWVVAGTAAVMLAILAGALYLAFGSISVAHEAMRTTLNENLAAALELYEKIGLSSQGVEILRERAPAIVDMVLRVMPALTFGAVVALVLINLFFLLRRFPERRSYWTVTSDLREWRAPELLVWCFIAAGFGLFLPGWAPVKVLALNLFLIVAVFYFFQGLSIIAYYFHHKHVPFFLRSLAYALIVFEQVFTLLVVGLGLFDLWSDFRGLKKKDLTPSQAA